MSALLVFDLTQDGSKLLRDLFIAAVAERALALLGRDAAKQFADGGSERILCPPGSLAGRAMVSSLLEAQVMASIGSRLPPHG